ncbi:MAG: aminotransferase class I/II-fold pyridoxal phosphate-dependent enzyme [Proteobacteria bacterium]|nr:aminotransferase class I/II-fold pyridoxal phosphate-dependent enzyme [Pseudomonadota bacterium]MBU1640788.1 aminotransferase class I/II-fold pyridoxal phosphate-dependent enzyme [Pseudomonadota bacterium]
MHSLSYNPDYFQKTLTELVPVLSHYLKSSSHSEQKVLIQKPIANILAELDFSRLISEGGGSLPEIITTLLGHCNHMLDPRYIGHQVAVPMMPAIFADLVNGVSNNAMPVYEMGPAATAVERGLISWFLGKTGWQTTGDGVLTHGGSLANQTCLLAARAHALPQAWEKGVDGSAVILASAACHYSIAKMAAILGLGTAQVIPVSVDEVFRMRREALTETYAAQKAAGKKIMAVVANACVTATGVYDPIRDIAEFCREHNLWLHIDGAHGASALVSQKYRHFLDGIELADSLTWDTHKMLGTSALCGAALFRRKKCLDGTFRQQGTYLFTDQQKEGVDISERTVECTKSMMGLKLFFNLAVLGEAGLATHVDTLYNNTRLFYTFINERPGFSCLCPPEANVLCFRYGVNSALQDSLRQELVAEGDFYITRATIHGESYLRLSVMNPLTAEQHISKLCDRLEQLAGHLKTEFK